MQVCFWVVVSKLAKSEGFENSMVLNTKTCLLIHLFGLRSGFLAIYDPVSAVEYNVQNNIIYLPIYTIKMDTSEGETPLIRDACPIVIGRIFFSFSRPSFEMACTRS